MEYKFNFYDISTYILPGTLTLSLIFWFIFDFTGYNIFPQVCSISSAILILIISYGVGYLILPIGSWIEHKETQKSGGYYSYKAMKPSSDIYSKEYIAQIKENSERIFNIKWDDPIPENKARYLELFYLCYYFAANRAQNNYIDTFNGIFGLYRNFCSVGIIGLIISLMILGKNYFLLIIPCINIFSWSYSNYAGLCGLFLSLFVYFSSKSQLMRFNVHFVNSIYRNFYVLSQNNP